MALSLLIVFLYGSMVWGIFPLFRDISWEGHLYGSLAGLLCAWFYRKHGMQRKVYEWENETDDTPSTIDYMQPLNETENAEINSEKPPADVLKIVHQKPIEIKYNYKDNEPGKN
ncbi:MAG: rhomboid family intramembrane serine protease [Bacteroidetes bacterium]|nr:rhomboid family intramembrane serine protease [Bacteroidota bacterium]